MEKIREIIRETIREIKNTNKIKFVSPNFDEEWNEAKRYPEFKEIGKEAWIKLANKGKSVSYNSIKDVLGNVDLNFDKLEEPKKQRFEKSFKNNSIEIPIAVKFNEDDYNLLAGNTRLAGLVKKGIEPKIWVVDISNVSEMLNYPNWLRNTAQVPQNNPDGEHRFNLPRKKIKEFAMGMMSPVEQAKHSKNMHRLMKILKKPQVNYFEYPNIPNTLMRKLYEASYEGNMGFEEIMKFYAKDDKEKIKQFEDLLQQNQIQQAWKLIQQETDVKLVGKYFN
jgi:hypothetical protein